MLAAWCPLWDWKADSTVLPVLSRNLSEMPLLFAPLVLFLLPPIAARAVNLLVFYLIKRPTLGHRWTGIDIVRLTFWNTLSPFIATLLVIMGFHDFYDRSLLGFLWLFAGAVCYIAGMVGQRHAEGFKPRKIKSGELYKRASVLAKKMNVPLEAVSIIPSGRGHLTNAHGGGKEIFMTDNYGKWLKGPELDSTIVHELAHCKQRHGRKLSLVMISIYTGLALAVLLIPARWLSQFHPLCDAFVVLGPVLIYYALVRRHEFAADAAEIEVMRQPEVSIRALVRLYRATGTPVDCPWLLELFMTHPSFTRRAHAMGQLGNLSDERIAELIQDAQPSRLTSV